MSRRCTICRHPRRESIDASLLRDGTRFTAKQFQISRPALDRHKRHLPESVVSAGHGVHVATNSEEAKSLRSRIDLLMGLCEKALMQAKESKDLSRLIRLVREMRAFIELKSKMDSAEPRNLTFGQTTQEQVPEQSDEGWAVVSVYRICSCTGGFRPLKMWQLKTIHDKVMELKQAGLKPHEIADRMILHTPTGGDLTLADRLYGILRAEEWAGREEVAHDIVQNLREGLKHYPGILQHLDQAFSTSAQEPLADNYHQCVL